MADITVAALTEASLAGSGIFDVLMRATKAHLEQEYSQNRIRGVEYSTVYLGSLESTMRTALEFLLQSEKNNLEAQLMGQQILLAQKEVEKATAQTAQVIAQTALIQQDLLNKQAELAILQANALKVPAEVAVLTAQTAKMEQETKNAITENLVLQGQKCKLDAEYDILLEQKTKTTTETGLLAQKVITEKAQTTSLGIDENSVLGRQKALYQAQTTGFTRDAEQKVAKIMADTWNVRRTTDDGTVADTTNMLNDATIGRAINKMLSGVGA